MITPIFFSISYIISGVLNSYKRFFAFSLAPLLYNLSIIIGAVWASPRFGVVGVVYFVIIGSFLHLLIQIPALVKSGYKYDFIIQLKNKAVWRVARLMLPRSISLGANQILLTAFTAIASSLAAGSIMALNFANNIQTVPTVILGSSFATAVFPTLAEKIAKGDRNGFSFYLVRTIRAIGFLLIPSAVMLILLRAQAVRLILGTGKFNWDNTKMTAVTLGFFSISLIASGLIPILAKAFFALKNTKLPMYASVASSVFSIIIAYPLSKEFSVAGLALAFSIGSFIQLFMLFYAIYRKYPDIISASLIYAYLRIILVSLVMGGMVWLAMHLAVNYVDMTRFLGILEQTVFAVAVGFTVYLGLSYLLNCEEIKWVYRRKLNGPKDAEVQLSQDNL
jgi:putative peptidoglycan lipid II flippase